MGLEHTAVHVRLAAAVRLPPGSPVRAERNICGTRGTTGKEVISRDCGDQSASVISKNALQEIKGVRKLWSLDRR